MLVRSSCLGKSECQITLNVAAAFGRIPIGALNILGKGIGMSNCRRLSLFVSVFALVLASASFVLPSSAIPNVYISPRVSVGDPGVSFTVRVSISGSENVFAWEVKFGWNATVLDVTNVAEGDFLKGLEGRDTYFVNKTYQDQADTDYITLGCTRLGADTPGAAGSGILATVTFLVQEMGETTLDLHETKLRDSVPNPVEHTSTDGLFSNTAGFPTVSFTISPRKADIGDTITFDASSSSDDEGPIANYFWEFGDDSTANETDPLVYHEYTEGGKYPVTLTVTDSDGWNASVTQYATIRFTHDLVVYSVSVSHQTISPGETVTITTLIGNAGSEDESECSVNAYYDGTPTSESQTVSLASGQNRTLTFSWDTAETPEGTYRIKVVIGTAAGETSTADNTRLGTTVEVTPRSEFPWLYVGVGVAVVAIVVVVAILFLRRRGKKTP